MKIAVGYDSAGAPLGEVLVKHLDGKANYQVFDLAKAPDDSQEYYADMAARVSRDIISGKFDRAILVCGTGIGVCISANKVSGIRAALTHDVYSAGKASSSNNAQIITMGARVIGPEVAKMIADTWLTTKFDENGSSAENVAAINRLDS